jgi:hypothetical protein
MSKSMPLLKKMVRKLELEEEKRAFNRISSQ